MNEGLTEVIADEVEFIDYAKEKEQQQEVGEIRHISEDDIPF